MDSCGDSNALILSQKSKNRKQKSNSQIISSQDKQLSKSQKRKLKKLEEQKEQKIFLSKSLENLEKFKISDDAHMLLRASENIGKAETMREKRRRVMQFSKAGLLVPESDIGVKRKKVGSSEIEVDASESSLLETADKNATIKPMLIERGSQNCHSVPSQGSGELSNLSDMGRAEPSRSIKEVASEDCCKVMILNAENSLVTQSTDFDKSTAFAMGELKVESRASYGTRCIGVDHIPGPQIAPTVVHVSRPIDVENGRRDLPIIMMEQEIMETINSNISVIICGETGCGKTTQIPQFLYEAGYGSRKCPRKGGIIGVTQPRRVAVFSTAKRVAYELGVRVGEEVGFQVRHDKHIGKNCSIKFMTDGILLRELQSDFFLKHYSVIILDEAHERTLNTDILIGMLSRVIRLRQATYEAQQKLVLSGGKIKPDDRIYPLKLVLMSATLRVEDFTSGSRIFHEPPPVIEIPTRQFPVTKHFSKKTELIDYLGEAYKMVLKIHKKLPSGGILVFVTGQREVEDLCHKLRQASKQFERKCYDVDMQIQTSTKTDMELIDGYSMKEIDEALDTRAGSTESFSAEWSDESNDVCSSFSSGSDSELDIGSDFDDYEVTEEAADFNDNVNLDSLKAAFEVLTEKTAPTSDYIKKGIDSASQDAQPLSSQGEKNSSVVGPLHVLPLYAMLPAAAQLRVFEEIKDGERLVVVATNVAETSLTIPGIRYVVDTGREKVKEYNSCNGMESYEIKWISQASASQRAGRAGRTGPGHCYHLFSSAALCNEFQHFSPAEILKVPVDGVVLILKSMGISKVANFPFPTPPDATALVKAERCLVALEALDSKGRLTPLGKTMSQYPMSPRHSKLLLLAIQITKKELNVRKNLVLGYAVAVAAALSSLNPFVSQFDEHHINAEGIEQEDKSGSCASQKVRDQQYKLMKKEMKNSAKLCRRKFSNLRSDALTIAYALQGFEQSKDPLQFCKENALHLKTMTEMSKLRKQLLQLVFYQRDCGLAEEFSWTDGTVKDVEDFWSICSDENHLSEMEEDILCQAICAGWADRVAKRVRRFSVSSEGDSKVNAIRYQASLVDETVFLRRWSPVSKAAPEFLVYNELLHTKRPYIQGATSVKSEWLVTHAGSLCTFSAPLTDPMPFYDPHLDQVFCYMIPYFGPHSWELPRSRVPIEDIKQRVTVFAYALLDGQVLPCLKSVKEFMAALPSNILKPEALGQKRVGNLVSKLKTGSRTIDSCAMLIEAWKEDPQLLYSEILDWFQEKFRCQFEKLWEKMLKEAFLVPQDRFSKKIRKRK